jgi:Zn-dependent peptidase ImmA (M78 family)
MKGPNLTQFDVVQQQAEVVLSCYRKRFGLPNVVPAPVEIIAKELFGLDILDLKMERYGKRAKGGLSVGASAIVKDPTLNWRQFRFLVAHEIGHLVLHQKKVIEIDLEGERKEYRLEWPLESETCKGQKVREKTAETEANRFAAALLLPSQPLHEAMKRYRVIDAQAISELKEEFLVSVDVLLARIRDLRYHLC